MQTIKFPLKITVKTLEVMWYCVARFQFLTWSGSEHTLNEYSLRSAQLIAVTDEGPTLLFIQVYSTETLEN